MTSPKLAVHGVQSLIADTQLVEDPELERLGRLLRLSVHILARDQGQLSAQLLGRLHKPCREGTTKLLAQAFSELPQGVLIPRGGKHLSEPGSLFAVFEGHTAPVGGALPLPDNRRTLSWSFDHTLRLWDLESGEGQPLCGHADQVDGALLLPDGRRALSWSADATLRVWDLESGEGRPLLGHNRSVRGALLLPDGRSALSWSADATLRLWDLESGAGQPLYGHDGEVGGALMLPDGRRAISWSLTDTLWLWDLESGEGRPLEGHQYTVRALPLTDGRRVLSWIWPGSELRVWDLESGEGRPLQGPSRSVHGALLMPDGRRASLLVIIRRDFVPVRPGERRWTVGAGRC